MFDKAVITSLSSSVNPTTTFPVRLKGISSSFATLSNPKLPQHSTWPF